MNSARRPWLLALLPAAALAFLHLQWVHFLTWDEIEFFRATRWIASGRLPYRDFFEHHTPLQWFVFAPFSAIASGPGVASVILMRWIQAPVWILTLVMLYALARRLGAEPMRAAMGPLAVMASPQLVGILIEYRPDILGNVAYFAALLLALRTLTRVSAWSVYGVLMSLSVLANMRLAPLVIATSALCFVWRPNEERWRWNFRALWMLPAVAVTVASFLFYLYKTRSVAAFADMLQFNMLFDRLTGSGTLLPTLLTPIRSFDIAVVAIVVGGIAGALKALRAVRRPGPAQVIAILALISFLTVARLSVNYFYHLLTTMLLLAVLASFALTEGTATKVTGMLVATLTVIWIVVNVQPPVGEAMRQQDLIMREVDRYTRSDDKVWDGVGFALHRPPAYRYWFLPSAVRLMAKAGFIEPYDANHLRDDPPAAIIYNYRMRLWFQTFPETASVAMTHYVPLYRNLWVPGLSASMIPGRDAQWVVPRAGRYRIYESEVLLKHPWFSRPLEYADTAGPDAPRYEIPLQKFSATSLAGLRVAVDGVPQDSTEIDLKKGSVLRLTSHLAHPTGILVVPADLTRICITPAEPFL
jgi:hypothetical protein